MNIICIIGAFRIMHIWYFEQHFLPDLILFHPLKSKDTLNRGARTSSLSSTIILDIQRAPISFKTTSEALHTCLISAKGHYMSISVADYPKTLREDLRCIYILLLVHISTFILRLRALDYNNRLVRTIRLIGSDLSSSWKHRLPASA